MGVNGTQCTSEYRICTFKKMTYLYSVFECSFGILFLVQFLNYSLS
jgi:hypothetical protein